MTNVSSRVQFLVMKWCTYCSLYAPTLYCSKYHDAFVYLLDATIRCRLITQYFWLSVIKHSSDLKMDFKCFHSPRLKSVIKVNRILQLRNIEVNVVFFTFIVLCPIPLKGI